MKKLLGLLCAVALQIGIIGSANAITITNGSFESGTSGWIEAETTGSVDVVSQTTALGGTVYNPKAGDYFASLTADSSLLQMSLSWNAGDKLGFYWAFLAKDYIPYNDFAVFSIMTQSPDAFVVTLSDVAALGDYKDTGWKYYTYTFKSPGNGTIAFGSTNVKDQNLDSVLLVDGVTNNPVPEPGTMMLLGAGFLGLAIYGKRRRNA